MSPESCPEFCRQFKKCFSKTERWTVQNHSVITFTKQWQKDWFMKQPVSQQKEKKNIPALRFCNTLKKSKKKNNIYPLSYKMTNMRWTIPASYKTQVREKWSGWIYCQSFKPIKNLSTTSLVVQKDLPHIKMRRFRQVSCFRNKAHDIQIKKKNNTQNVKRISWNKNDL